MKPLLLLIILSCYAQNACYVKDPILYGGSLGTFQDSIPFLNSTYSIYQISCCVSSTTKLLTGI
jgi:hypothetical protein